MNETIDDFNVEGMYHKMPLIRIDKNTDIFHQAALSSKQQTKNALQEASYDTHPHIGEPLRPNGSITLEMVVVLPLFVSFMVFFLFLFRILLVQESMEEALVYTSRTLAVSCFSETPTEQKSQTGLLAEAQVTLQKGLKDSGCPVDYIRGGRAGISLLSSQLTGDEIVLRASYEIRVPCVMLGSYSFHFEQCAQSRKWIGNQSFVQDGMSDDEWVYVTPYGTVYHRDRTCRFLDLSIHAVSRQSLVALRNKDGNIYQKCESCGNSKNAMVYVTDYGICYHDSLVCSGLKRTIYMVKLSQVGGKNACSKCGARQ